MAFAYNLKQFPAVTHLAALQLINSEGKVVATIEASAQPGSHPNIDRLLGVIA